MTLFTLRFLSQRASRNGRCVLSRALAASGLTAAALVVSGCSSANPTGASIYTDAGGVHASGETAAIANDAGAQVVPFAVGGPADPGAGGVYVTISGESNAITGYPFPPESFTTATYLVDGWEFVIEEYLVNVDKVVLWSNPNLSATDQSLHGAQVAHLDGPFVVDLHKGGTVLGQGGSPEQATALGVITSQNDNGNHALDPTTTYGFGFSTVAASYAGFNVNLTADEFADFALMVQRGYSVLYSGTATWKGGDSPYACTQTSAGGAADAGTASSDAGDAGAVATGGSSAYDFTRLPPTMTFKLGFSTPTNYVNCQNFTAQGAGIGGEDSPRGVQVSPSQSAIAQVTVHMDHPFWESLAEDSPVHWDQIAAQYVGAAGTPLATIEDMKGVPFYAFVDNAGTPLPWRNCSGTNYAAPGNGQMFFNPLSVPVGPAESDPSKALRDYYDYIRYTQSTQGHLNSQGLCFIARQYPAPPGGS
jgi:hypothetical protein